MRSWRSSAAYRIAFANLGALLLGLAVLGVVVFFAMHIAFTRQLDATITDEARNLVDEMSASPEAAKSDSDPRGKKPSLLAEIEALFARKFDEA